MKPARYDGVAAWYGEFRPALSSDEIDVLQRLLGHGPGRCLDLGCGTGVALEPLRALGWSVVGADVSEDLLDVARKRGLDAVVAPAEALPFDDASFDAAVSIWTHTDVDDFGTALSEISRVLRRDAPFVYMGAHPCFVGPHSRFIEAKGVPTLHEGYRTVGRYDDGPAIGPDGLRARVGATHLPLGLFVQAFLDAGFRLERFEELGSREYPYVVALRCRRP
ncbi:MAG TPA: methyltransferase domain-containing protein [Gaiellaceae bacterium]|nr:methyltransferase domain-containing protein [Gaiellaceae bacterium]